MARFFRSKRRFGRRRFKARKVAGYKKMLGHVANKGLSYASNFGGPIGAVARTVRWMKTMINSETKYVDITGSAVVPNTPSAPFSLTLNAMAEGDDYNQRNGRSIINDSLTINWACEASTQSIGTFITIWLLADKKPDIGTLTLSEVIGSSGDYLSQIDKANNGDRVVILKHAIIPIHTNMITRSGKIYVNLKNTHTKYDATTADFENNRLYLLAISNESTNLPTLTINSRFRYRDN